VRGWTMTLMGNEPEAERRGGVSSGGSRGGRCPCRCGGLAVAKRQIEILLNEGLMWLGSGLTDPDISMAAALELYGAFDLTKPVALNGPQFLTTDVLTRPLDIKNGSATVPVGHGLGIEVDETKVIALMKKTTGSETISI